MNSAISETRIILADDDMEDLVFLEDVLVELNFLGLLLTVHNGKQLMDTLASLSKPPDLMFIDYNMPVKNGLDCLVEIKKNEFWSRIPVVMISGITNKMLVERIYSEGAQFFLEKGSPEVFKKSVADILSVFFNSRNTANAPAA